MTTAHKLSKEELAEYQRFADAFNMDKYQRLLSHIAAQEEQLNTFITNEPKKLQECQWLNTLLMKCLATIKHSEGDSIETCVQSLIDNHNQLLSELKVAWQRVEEEKSERDQLKQQLEIEQMTIEEEQLQCDHEWKEIDASFDHEFGVEQVFYRECQKCGLTGNSSPFRHGDEEV